jgi:hypothetical protein
MSMVYFCAESYSCKLHAKKLLGKDVILYVEHVLRDLTGFEPVTYGLPIGNMPCADGSTD